MGAPAPPSASARSPAQRASAAVSSATRCGVSTIRGSSSERSDGSFAHASESDARTEGTSRKSAGTTRRVSDASDASGSVIWGVPSQPSERRSPRTSDLQGDEEARRVSGGGAASGGAAVASRVGAWSRPAAGRGAFAAQPNPLPAALRRARPPLPVSRNTSRAGRAAHLSCRRWRCG